MAVKNIAGTSFSEVHKEIELSEEKAPKNGFNFSGRDSLAKPIRGRVPYTSSEEARERLAYSGIALDKLTPVADVPWKRRKRSLPDKVELAQLAEQIGEQFEIGISPDRICLMLSKVVTNELIGEALENISDRLRNGQPVADAFEAQSDDKGRSIFPITFIAALRIGSEIGALTDPEDNKSVGATTVMLRFFAEGQKKANELQKKIKSALAYPGFVMAAVTVAFVIAVYAIIPGFTQMYTGLLSGNGKKDTSLPAITQFVVSVSDFLRSPTGWVVIVLFAATLYAIFHYFYKTRKGVEKRQRWAVFAPLIGEFYRPFLASVFLRDLSMMWAGESNAIKRFQILAETADNPLFKEMAEHIAEILLKQSVAIPALFTPYYALLGDEMASVAETIEVGGDAQKQLYSYAKVLEQRADERLDWLMGVLPQVCLMIAAAFVVGLMFALYAPLFTIVSRLSN